MINAANYHQTETLKRGQSVQIRSIRPDDKGMILEAFNNLEPESIYTRYFYHKKDLSENELKTTTKVDFESEVALVVTVGEGLETKIIGTGRYVVLDTTDTQQRAEVAFTVEEDYQGQGIASYLLKHLTRIARYKGLIYFVATVLPENKAMLKVFSCSGLPIEKKWQGDVTHVRLALGDTAA